MDFAIQDCFSNHSVRSFYFDLNDTNAHLTGFLSGYDKDNVFISHISMHGLYDGYIVASKDSLYRIDTGGEYEQKIRRLYDLKQQKHQNVESLMMQEENVMRAAIQFARKNNYVVSVSIDDTCISGFIDSTSDSTVTLSIINDYGRIQGTTEITLNSVSSIAIDTDDEQDLKLLAISP